ncbi:Senescence-associated protein [Orobanche hederae]
MASQDRNPNRTPIWTTSSIEESYITIPGAILHLIDTHYSVELAASDLRILLLRQGDNTVAVLAAVSDEIEWPLTKDLAAVKLDTSHYFFSFCPPRDGEDSDSSDEDGAKKNKKKDKKKKKKKEEEKKKENDVLSYGHTIVSNGQERFLKEL